MQEKNKSEELLESYKPLVISIARRYYLVGAEMDDLIQEGMIGLYKATLSYDEEKKSSFSNFASLCIKRQIQTAIKHNNRLKNSYFKDLINEDDFYITEVLSTEDNPENKVISQEEFLFVKQQINNKLTIMEKKILKEYLIGKSYDEIASSLNMNKKSVDNGLNRIRKKLQYLLNERS